MKNGKRNDQITHYTKIRGTFERLMEIHFSKGSSNRSNHNLVTYCILNNQKYPKVNPKDQVTVVRETKNSLRLKEVYLKYRLIKMMTQIVQVCKTSLKTVENIMNKSSLSMTTPGNLFELNKIDYNGIGITNNAFSSDGDGNDINDVLNNTNMNGYLTHRYIFAIAYITTKTLYVVLLRMVEQQVQTNSSTGGNINIPIQMIIYLLQENHHLDHLLQYLRLVQTNLHQWILLQMRLIESALPIQMVHLTLKLFHHLLVGLFI